MIGGYVEARLVDFVSSQVEAASAKGVVLGLSGGLDSAVTALLAKKALGPDKVTALLLPERGVTTEEDIEDARTVADRFDLETVEIDISRILSCYTDVVALEKAPRLVQGNLKARIRMTLLYWHANLYGRLVLGTGNKTEIMLGYSTKYGDAAADVLPLAGLYKDEVRALGARLGVPRRILEKAPSAGLWPGQTDEEEMGISYREADGILRAVERGLGPDELKDSYQRSKVNLVLERIEKSRHKREMPPRPRMW